jgi:TonB family protein
MDAVWRNHMPNAANDPWVKGAIVLVRFAIMPDGSIDTPIVTLSSGRKGYDQHALQTVLGTAPFDPLPAGLNRPQPICMRFGYNKNPEPKKTRPLDPWELPAKPAP